MTPAQLLFHVGPLLFGDQWKSAMERLLRIRAGRVDDWSKGRGAPPFGVWRELATLIEDRRDQLSAVHGDVLKVMETLSPPAQEIEIRFAEMDLHPDDGDIENPAFVDRVRMEFAHVADLVWPGATLRLAPGGYIVALKKAVDVHAASQIKGLILNSVRAAAFQAFPKAGR